MGKKVYSNAENAGAIFPVSTPVSNGKGLVTAKIGLPKNMLERSLSTKTGRMGLGKMNGDRPSSWEMFTPQPPAPTMAPAETVSRAGKDRHTDPFSTERATMTTRIGKKVFEPVQKEEAVQKRKTYSRVSTATPAPKIRPTGRSTQGNSSNVSTLNLVDIQSLVKSTKGRSMTPNPSRKPAGPITELGEGTAPRRCSLRTKSPAATQSHPQKWLNDKPMSQYSTSLNGVWTPIADRVPRVTPAPAPFATMDKKPVRASTPAPGRVSTSVSKIMQFKPDPKMSMKQVEAVNGEQKACVKKCMPTSRMSKGLLNPKPYTPAEASSAKLLPRVGVTAKTLSIMNRQG